jgi:hypothetical protein
LPILDVDGRRANSSQPEMNYIHRRKKFLLNISTPRAVEQFNVRDKKKTPFQVYLNSKTPVTAYRYTPLYTLFATLDFGID